MQRRILTLAAGVLLGATIIQPLRLPAANAQILGWNNLGMHCMDSDYSVFSILPPYNTIQAQLIVKGALITSSNGYLVTYQAVADPSGSINKTSIGKGNWVQFAPLLYGAVPPDQGLAFPGPEFYSMPGTNNTPQQMLFEQTNQPAAGVFTPVNWFHAYGVPITPYDDAGKKNPYPLMRLIGWSGSTPIATNNIVLPVSDEMDCRACHASGSGPAAMPAAGWVWDGLPERDYRLNILRLHDENNFASNAVLYAAALAARGFDPAGLYRNVTADGKPVLCAACHASEALAAPSYGTIPPLTASVHGFHAQVMDPAFNLTLDNAANRAACYRCHPGSTTKCLRGAMGTAVASDGSMEMQCQNCHGNMSTVGSTNRVGWFMEPACQSCHTGTATSNNGQIRYTSCFTDTNGTVRMAVNQTFATQPNTPAPGLSLFRFSAGHGGLQCEACHGSTHAEFPSSHVNDNLRDIALQGHAGVMVECTACHVSMNANSTNAAAGPHGMHPIGQNWVSAHHDLIGSIPGGVASCQACHGLDYRGTVLSRAQGPRTLTASFDAGSVTLNLFRGAVIGCYNCHNGPGNDNLNTNTPPTVGNISTNITNDKNVTMTLPATGSGLTLRIISQPVSGSVGLTNNQATYFPNPGFVGADNFTFAAYDGSKNSALGTGTVSVAQGPFALGVAGHVPPSYPAAWSVAFAAVPAVTNTVASVTYDWNFGDGTPHGTTQYTTHAYDQPGPYIWTVVATASGQSAVDAGLIEVGSPMLLSVSGAGNGVTLTWPNNIADTLLLNSSTLGPGARWLWLTNAPASNGNLLSVTLPATSNGYFRLKQPW